MIKLTLGGNIHARPLAQTLPLRSMAPVIKLTIQDNRIQLMLNPFPRRAGVNQITRESDLVAGLVRSNGNLTCRWTDLWSRFPRTPHVVD